MDIRAEICRGWLGRSAWGALLRWSVAAAFPVLALGGEASGIVNPHDTSKPKYCLNCHTAEIYTKDCNESEGFCLLGGSVDGLCLTCHLKEECCRVGLEHLPKLHIGQRSHPSDLEAERIPRAYLPKSLPMHQGRVTCRTCHLHSREHKDGYKMLRRVKVTGQAVDWSGLCQDCHKDR